MDRPRPLLLAILLGALTIVVTPAIVFLFGGAYLLLGRIPGFDPTVTIGKTFHWGMTEFLIAGFAIVFLLALLGDLAAVAVSWRMLRSKQFALVTFASAIGCQLLGMGVMNLDRGRQERIYAAHPRPDAMGRFKTYAALGEIRTEAGDPLGDGVVNPREDLGPQYRTLVLAVPVDVRHAGRYLLSVRYEWPAPNFDLTTPWVDSTCTLATGPQVVRIDLDTSSPSWFRTPRAVGGRSMARLQYMATYMERREARKDVMTLEQWERLEKLLRSQVGPDTLTRPMFVDTLQTSYAGGERFLAKPKHE